MRSLVCALMLVACSKPGGVELDIVSAPDNVTAVRVYIGTVQLPDVSSLTVPTDASGAVQTASGPVFTRESTNANDRYTYTPGTSLNLEFESSDNPDQSSLPAVIVVGFDDGGNPIASSVLTNLPLQAHAVAQYKVQLHLSSVAANSARQLFLWSPDLTTPLGDAACVGFVSGETAAFIVTAGDTDCDGFPDDSTLECEPLHYKDTMAMASLADGMCFDSGRAECRLGADLCIDGQGPTASTCSSANNLCMPVDDCACPVSGSDTPLDCVLEQVAQSSSLSAYNCSIGTTIDPSGCSITVGRPPTGGFGCKPPGGNSQTGIAVQGDGTFDTSVEVEGITYELDVGSDCGITLQATGSTTSQSPFGMIVRIDLDDPDGQSSLVLPIAVTPDNGSCQISNSGCEATAGLTASTLTTCAAGWTNVTDSKLAGFSPTLSTDMTEIFFLVAGEDDTTTIQTATRASATAAWSNVMAVGIGFVLGQNPVAIHLSEDGMSLFVVDNNSAVLKFSRTGPGAQWLPGTPPTLVISNFPNAYAPDSMDHDAIYATTMGDMFELVDPETTSGGSGSSGSGSAALGNVIGPGQTPFLTNDDLTLWFAQSNETGVYTIAVASRATVDDAFSPVVPIGELATSVVPQAPWVSPDRTTIFYAVGGTTSTAEIYSAAR